jgi:hypothetical protein
LAGNPNVAFRFVFKSDDAVNSDGVAIDDFQISGPLNNPLPIELLQFIGLAMPLSNKLDWSTASESNNAGFFIQKSISGFEWNTIGFLKGMGNSNQITNYSFSDFDTKHASVYYRLKQVDLNGTSSISQPINILRTISDKASLIVVYPNPIKESIQIKSSSFENENFVLSLWSLKGEKLMERNSSFLNGFQSFEISYLNLPTGTYLLVIDAQGKRLTKKLSKVN